MSARFAGIALILISLAAGRIPAQEIHLKTRNIQPGAPDSNSAASLADTHQVVQFDHTPSVEDLDNLLAGGAQVVAVVPDNAVVVSSPGNVVTVAQGILSVARIEAADKLSPALGTAEPLTAIVEFHGDVSQEQQEAVAAWEGVTLLRPAALYANHAIVTGSLSDLRVLAAHDEVAYIFPADPGLLTGTVFNGCAGMLTLSGPIAQYANLVHGWSLDSDNVAHLGYVFGSLTTKAPAAQVESEILRALNAWAQITNVTFTPGTLATAARTVAIKFASGAHGDAYPFDGPGGVLAHTFYPVPVNPESIAGDMHLDADEDWHIGGDTDIFSVALHEAGHAIGLGHSDSPGDVMYPYYRRGMSLSANDIGAAQALYGVPAASAPAAVTTAPVTTTVPVTTTTAAAPAPAPPAAPAAPAPATLRVALSAAPASTQSNQVAVSGSISGGTAPFSVQWQTDHGYAGTASLGGALNWTASGIALVNGTNTISVTAFDANHQSATASEAISLTPPATTSSPGSASPVAVSITTPSSSMVSVNTATISLGGTASGGAGITKVTWQTSNGCTGTAAGTTHWLASAIPLLTGTNTVVVRAYDANGANTWAAVVAVRN